MKQTAVYLFKMSIIYLNLNDLYNDYKKNINNII